MHTLAEGTRGATVYPDLVKAAIGALGYFRDVELTAAHLVVLTPIGPAKPGESTPIVVEIRYMGSFAGYLREGE